MQNGATNTTDEAGGEMITGALCMCVSVCVYVCGAALTGQQLHLQGCQKY